ncbi:MAG: LysM peptidoglycan-binding domain-containing protein [Ilumatobacteraceae bacterium]
MLHDDDLEFWEDGHHRPRTGPIPRLSRVPSHDERHPTNVDHAYSAVSWERNGTDEGLWDDHGRFASLRVLSRRTDRRPNFLARRIGALIAVGLVAAPIALAFAGSDETAPRVRAAEAPVQQPIIGADPAVPLDAGTATNAVVTTLALVPGSIASAPARDSSVASPVPLIPASTSPLQAQPPSPAPPPSQVAAQTSAPAAETLPTPSEAVQTAAADAAVTVERACSVDYHIVAGDYWILIADKVSVRLSEILAANGADVGTPLYPGRSICLPANASAPTTDAPSTTNASTTAPATTVPVRTAAATTAPVTTALVTTVPATTVPPTTMPATTVPATSAPPKNTYSRAQVEQIIRDVWPDDLEDEALRIATRESNLIPTVRNYCCFGLFQIYWDVHKRWLTSAGITSSAQLYDPHVNTYAAFAMYLRAGGWGPWS